MWLQKVFLKVPSIVDSNFNLIELLQKRKMKQLNLATIVVSLSEVQKGLEMKPTARKVTGKKTIGNKTFTGILAKIFSCQDPC